MNIIHAGISIGVTELRESPTRILKRAEDEDQAVAILHHNTPAGDIISPSLDSYEPLAAELDDFLVAGLTGRRPQSNAESGLAVVRVLEAAERSLTNGGHLETLEWEPLELVSVKEPR